MMDKKSSFKKFRRAPNVDVKDGETFDWIPGTYGKVTFGYQSNITIHAGEYDVDHLEIKNQVNFIFDDVSGNCSDVDVAFSAQRTINIGADFQMSGINFGDVFCCYGAYRVMWVTCGDFDVRESQYPLYGVVLANQRVKLQANNVWHGCFFGNTGVDLKTDAELINYGNSGCSCNTIALANPSFETGDLTGWNLNRICDFDCVNSSYCANYETYDAQSGSFFFIFGAETLTSISQTVEDNPNQPATISFYLQCANVTGPYNACGTTNTTSEGCTEGPVDVSVLWNGLPVLVNPPCSGQWTQVLIPVTTTGSDTLELDFTDFGCFAGLDNFSISYN